MSAESAVISRILRSVMQEALHTLYQSSSRQIWSTIVACLLTAAIKSGPLVDRSE